MKAQRNRKLLPLDAEACKRAAHLIVHATPSLVPDVIERPETDWRVRRYLEAWLASQPRRAA